jgi:AAA ATPase domain
VPAHAAEAELHYSFGRPDEVGRVFLTGLYYAGGIYRTVAKGYLKQLCEDTLAFLSATITDEIGKIAATDLRVYEQDEHWRFARKRAEHFTGREAILASIEAYIEGNDRRPFVVWGARGGGKTALLARAAIVAVYEDRHNAGSVPSEPAEPSEHVITRFVGATPSSSDGRSLLESLCGQLARRYGQDEGDLPSEYNALVKTFQAALAYATAEQPLVIFLDALDQLSRTYNAQNTREWGRQNGKQLASAVQNEYNYRRTTSHKSHKNPLSPNKNDKTIVLTTSQMSQNYQDNR